MLGRGRLLVVQWGCLAFSKARMGFGGTWRSSQSFIHLSSFYWVTTMYQIKCWVLDSTVCEREIRDHFSSLGVERNTSRTTRPGSVNFPFWAVSTEEKLEILSPENWERWRILWVEGKLPGVCDGCTEIQRVTLKLATWLEMGQGDHRRWHRPKGDGVITGCVSQGQVTRRNQDGKRLSLRTR